MDDRDQGVRLKQKPYSTNSPGAGGDDRPAAAAASRSTDIPKQAAAPRIGSIARRVGAERTGVLLRCSQVALAFEALGDRWSSLILKEIFLGINQFGELLAATGASRNMLTNRLLALVKKGILHKHPYRDRPVRYEYRLTRMGEDLYATALMYWLWEHRYGGDFNLPPVLFHRTCGHAMLPTLVCQHCSNDISISTIQVDAVEGFDERLARQPRRHSLHLASHGRECEDEQVINVIDVIGDRWTSLVQAAAYFGLDRYADIQLALLIPTNTLADRLRLLMRSGLFERTPYQNNPVRYSYRLTEKGRALYYSAFTLHQWAERWLVRDRVASISLMHRTCGQPAVGQVVCSHCSQELRLMEVETRGADEA